MGLWLKMLWDTLISVSLAIIVIALIVEFFFHPGPQTLELIHTLDVIALSFLFTELVYDFYKAENKQKFVTKEWLLIISFLPFGTILRLTRIFRASRVIKFLSRVWARITRVFRAEVVGVKGVQAAVHVSKVAPKAGKAIRPIAQFMDKREKQLKKMRKR